MNEFKGMLLLPTLTETLCIPLEVIIRIEASSNYSKVYCKWQAFPIVASKVLRWFETRLPESLFARVHRTHLVNKNYVVAVRKNQLLLETGMAVAISRRKKRMLLAGVLLS